MKSLAILIVLVSLSFARYDIDIFKIKKGWNLLSFPYDKDIFSILSKNSNIKSIWSYDKKWKAYVKGIDNIEDILKKHNIAPLKSISFSSAYWVLSKDDFELYFEKNLFIEDINLTKGWNFLGFLYDKTSIYEIGRDNLFWKYKDKEWLLGENKRYNGIKSFKDILSKEGVWIYANKNGILKQDSRKKFLFLDKDLIPQQVVLDGKEATINGFVYDEYLKSRFDFNQTGYMPINGAKFEINKQLVHKNIASSNGNYVIFLDKTNQAVLKDSNSSAIEVFNFTLSDYFQNFYPIKSIAIEAMVVNPLFIAKDYYMEVSIGNLKQSVSMSFYPLQKPENLPEGKFILGTDMSVVDNYGNHIELEELDGQLNLKPTFIVSSKVEHPFIYALNGSSWELVGEGFYREYDGKKLVDSKNWYGRFAKFVLMDVDKESFYKKSFTVRAEDGKSLRDVVIVSDQKIVTSTDGDGNFTYTAPQKPKKLIAYKRGYKITPIDINKTNIILKKLDIDSLDTLYGARLSYDKNLSLSYSLGKGAKRFTFDNRYIKNNIPPKIELLADTKFAIYSKIYPYKDGFVFGASDSTIVEVKDGKIKKLYEGGGIIYDGLVVKNDTIYCGTFGDNFIKISDKGVDFDEALSDANFLETGLSVVYKPLVTNSKIYLPLYNQKKSTDMTMIIKDDELNNITSFSSLGTPGRLSEIDDKIVFGTSKSKIVLVDKNSDEKSLFDFNGGAILSKVVKLDDSYFAIDLNGSIKKIAANGSIIALKQLTPSSNLFSYKNNLIVAGFDGKIYKIDKNLDIISSYSLDSGVLANPVVYKDDIYFITKSGSFYKNDIKIGSFNTKVTNINLLNNTLLFGGENGSIWRVRLK